MYLSWGFYLSIWANWTNVNHYLSVYLFYLLASSNFTKHETFLRLCIIFEPFPAGKNKPPRLGGCEWEYGGLANPTWIKKNGETPWNTYLVGGLEPWNFMTFHSVGNVIIATDELHHFSEGLFYQQPGMCTWWLIPWTCFSNFSASVWD